MIELAVLVIYSVLLVGVGYGFRGLISRELKALHVEQVKVLAELKAEIKAEISKTVVAKL